jgi:hypothetical protein
MGLMTTFFRLKTREIENYPESNVTDVHALKLNNHKIKGINANTFV